VAAPAPAGDLPGAGVPRRRGGPARRELLPRALQRSLRRHGPLAASVCKWGSGGSGRRGPRRRERGQGPPLLQPAAPESARPYSGRQVRWRAGERKNRLSSASPPLCHSRERQEGEKRAGGSPGRPRDPGPLCGWDSGVRLALHDSLCAEFASGAPELARDPGGAGRAARAECRGRGGAGARGGNPRLALPLPGSLSLSPR
jgi:hypothetical protein